MRDGEEENILSCYAKASQDPSGFFDCCAGGDDVIENNHKSITHGIFIFDCERIFKIFQSRGAASADLVSGIFIFYQNILNK